MHPLKESSGGAERIVGQKVRFKIVRRRTKKGNPQRILQCEGRIVDLCSCGVIVIGENVSGRYSRALDDVEFLGVRA